MEIPLMSEKEYDDLARTLAGQGSLALHEHQPDLEHLRIGLSWDKGLDSHLDLDLAALLLNEAGQARGPQDFVFYNQRQSACRSVCHLGEYNPKHQSSPNSDNDILLIDLSRVPEEVSRIALVVSIYKGNYRQQNFGLVRNARVSLYNEGREGARIAQLNLTEDVALATAAVVGELQRRGRRDWHYVAIGLGDENGIENLLIDYGLAS